MKALGFALCFIGYHDLKPHKAGSNCARCGIRWYLNEFDRNHYITRIQDLAAIGVLIAFVWLLSIGLEVTA